MEYKNLLQNWKSYQRWKYKNIFKMAGNRISCSLTSKILTVPQASLEFVEGPEARILLHCERFVAVSIKFEDIRGFSHQGQSIQITLKELDAPAPILNFVFPNEVTHAVAVERLENFVRENQDMTPPSSESPPSN